jgi:hypothetical protein
VCHKSSMDVPGAPITVTVAQGAVLQMPGRATLADLVARCVPAGGAALEVVLTSSGQRFQPHEWGRVYLQELVVGGQLLHLSIVLRPRADLQQGDHEDKQHCSDGDDDDETSEGSAGVCICQHLSARNDDDDKGSWSLSWRALNRYLSSRAQVEEHHLAASATKRVHAEVALSKFHSDHAWVEVNEVLHVGKNSRRATQYCHRVVAAATAGRTYIDGAERKWVALCALPQLLEAFASELTLEEMGRTLVLSVAWEEQQQPLPPLKVRVAVRRKREPIRDEEDDDPLLKAAAAEAIKAWENLVAVQELFPGILGPLEDERLRRSIEALSLILSRSEGKRITLGEEEDEARAAMEGITQWARETPGCMVAVLARATVPLPAPGTVVAYRYSTGVACALRRHHHGDEDDDNDDDDDSVMYRLVVARERAQLLLLDPHGIQDDDAADEQGVVALAVVGPVSQVRLDKGDLVPGARVCMQQGALVAVTPATTTTAADEEEGLGLIGSLDGHETATVHVDTHMWVETLLRAALRSASSTRRGQLGSLGI